MTLNPDPGKQLLRNTRMERLLRLVNSKLDREDAKVNALDGLKQGAMLREFHKGKAAGLLEVQMLIMDFLRED